MSDNKKYYYFKLKEDFFDKDNMKVIESQPNGFIYSNILLKLYLRALKGNGRLMMTDRIPYDPGKIEILAKVIGHDTDHVKQALKLACDLDKMTILESGEMWMNDIQDYIGHSSTEADRKRKYRRLLDDKNKKGTNVQTNVLKCPDKSPLELKKEIDKEQDKEQEGLSFQEKICNAFSKEYMKRFLIHYPPTETNLDKAWNIIKDAEDREEMTKQIISVIPLFFEKPYWFNSVDQKKTKVDRTRLTPGNFLAHCIEMLADSRASPVKGISKEDEEFINSLNFDELR